MMNWPRLFTAMVTPFTGSGALDAPSAGRLARQLRDHGSGGLVLAGSTGEAFSLNMPERLELFQAVRESVGQSLPIWMGCGTNDTRSSVELVQAADSWGVDGVLLVSPYYNKPTQEGLVRHFRTILAETTCPAMLYNVPGRTSSMVEASTVARIAETASGPFAVKEASGSIDQIMRLRQALDATVPVYSGDDALYLASLAVGAYGVVSVASHVVGDEMAALSDLFLQGHYEEAQRMHRDLWPLFKALFCVSNPIPLKWLLGRLSLAPSNVRMPLYMPPDEVFIDLWASYLQAKHILDSAVSA